MSSFKVPCPSCEAQVLIKNPNLVGTKVECPKCKYRFKVEAPAGTADEPAAKGKKDDKKAAKAGGKGNKKMLGIGLGVAAVLLLAIGGYAMFGGSSGPPKGTTPPGRQPGPVTQAGNTDDPNTKKEANNKDDGPKPPPKSNFPPSKIDPTNLLPNQTVAVYRLNVRRLRWNSELRGLFDKTMLNLFRSSMGFDPDRVETYYHCVVGDTRAPFGVMRLDSPMDPKALLKGLQLEPDPKEIKKHTLHQVRSNHFFAAVSNTFAARSLLADVYDQVPVGAAGRAGKPDKADRPIGICVYDTQTVLVGDLAVLEQFLNDLKDNGYPEFRHELLAPAPTVDPELITADEKKEEPKKEEPKKEEPKKEEPKKGKKKEPNFTTIPTYRTIDGELKKMLNTLYESEGDAPLVVLAEKFDPREYDPSQMNKRYEDLGKLFDTALRKTRYVGAYLNSFTSQQLSAGVRLVTADTSTANQIAVQQLTPPLNVGVPMLELFLGTPVVFRNYATGEVPLDPEGPQAVPGQPSSAPPPVNPGPGPGPGRPSGPIGPGGGEGRPAGPGQGRPQPGGLSAPPGPGLPPPGAAPPGVPAPGTEPVPPPPPTISYVDLDLTDNVVTLSVDLNWPLDNFPKGMRPAMVNVVNMVKGKMAVFAGSDTWHGLAAAVREYVKKNGQFPRGTSDRAASAPESRVLSMRAQPAQRVSFFAELLPYLGRADLRGTIDAKNAWFEGANADAGEWWVPELLIPYYPQGSWRAVTPFASTRVFGGTDFVAIAGVGADAARLDPRNPRHQKAVGITGYDWFSTVKDVPDGLDKTIYLMQVAPGYSRPWIAGGGATVMGLDPNDPLGPFVADHPDGRGGTKRGTYAIMGDGTVRWIPATIDPKVLLALATRAGGEPIDDIDKAAPKVEPVRKADEEEAPAPAPKAEPEKKAPEAKTEPKKGSE